MWPLSRLLVPARLVVADLCGLAPSKILNLHVKLPTGSPELLNLGYLVIFSPIQVR